MRPSFIEKTRAPQSVSAAHRPYSRQQTEAISAMQQSLATQIQALTGYSIVPGSIYVDSDGQTATACIHDIIFRLHRDAFKVVRPCCRCGIGQFESPELNSATDCKRILDAWEPLCQDCTAAQDADERLDELEGR